MIPSAFSFASALAFGSVFGSFMNVLIHRLPLGIDVVHSRSRCPHCLENLSWYDNVPLLSYLVLRARCRRCRMPISIRYPLVEIAMGLTVAFLFRSHHLSAELIYWGLFGGAMIVLMMIDYDHGILPDAITYPGTVLGLAGAFYLDRFMDGVTGVLVGGGSLLAIFWIYYLLRKIEGMGMGDVKMMAMAGAFLGWRNTVLMLIGGSLLGSLWAIVLMLRGKASMQSALPFGTFLALAGLLVLFFGNQAWDFYWSLVYGSVTLPPQGPLNP